MATFPAVANIVQTSPATGSKTTSSSSNSTDSFSSHLQAATSTQAQSQSSSPASENKQVGIGAKETLSNSPQADISEEQASPGQDSETVLASDTLGRGKTKQEQQSLPDISESSKNSETTSPDVETLGWQLSSAPPDKIPEHQETLLGQMLAQLSNNTISENHLEKSTASTSLSHPASEIGLQLSSTEVAINNIQVNQVPLTNQQILNGQFSVSQTAMSSSSDLSTGQDFLAEGQSLNAQQLPSHKEHNLATQNSQQTITLQASTGTTVTLNPQDGTIITSNQLSQQAEAAAPPQNVSLLYQNKDGQIISIEQGKDSLQQQTATTALSANQTLYQNDTIKFDLNSRYLHSNLDHSAALSLNSENQNSNGEQSQSGLLSDENQDFKGLQNLAPSALLQEDSAKSSGSSTLPFGIQLASSQLTSQTTSSNATGTTAYQLSSGNIIPDTAVVDQMIAHFSTNKPLESGTVNIRLHPQELGELRLEIKVKDDNVKAHIITQSPHSQEMLDRHMSKLKEALEQQGLNLQEIEISVDEGNTEFEEQYTNNNSWQQSHQFTNQKQSRVDFSMDGIEDNGEEEDIATNFNAVA